VQPSVREFQLASDGRVGQGTEVSVRQPLEQHPSLEPCPGLHRSRYSSDFAMESSDELEEEGSHVWRAVHRSDYLYRLSDGPCFAVYPGEGSVMELHNSTDMAHGRSGRQPRGGLCSYPAYLLPRSSFSKHDASDSQHPATVGGSGSRLSRNDYALRERSVDGEDGDREGRECCIIVKDDIKIDGLHDGPSFAHKSRVSDHSGDDCSLQSWCDDHG
jgi:hypothetical protein